MEDRCVDSVQPAHKVTTADALRGARPQRASNASRKSQQRLMKMSGGQMPLVNS